MTDPNRTQMGAPPVADPNRTIMGGAPSLNATVTIKPVQCPVCKSFNPPGMMYCNDCGLIFEMALEGDAFGAPAIQLPCLVDGSGREHQLRPGPNVLGRQGDIALDDPRVSRRHAQIVIEGGRMTLEDLGSTNGTKLDGQPVTQGSPAEVGNGAKVSLGGLEFTVSVPGEAGKTLAAMSGKTVGLSGAPTVSDTVAWLVFPDREEPLSPGKKTFGRKSDNDIVIPDPYVSGRHGEIEADDSGVYVTDTGSTNGTVLNEGKLQPNQRTQLREGDVIKLGSLEIGVRFKE